MIEFKNIELEDKAYISSVFKRLNWNFSECCFTNLFMWRKCYHIRWTNISGFLVILTGYKGRHWILPPFGDYSGYEWKKVILQLMDYFKAEHIPFLMKAVPGEAAERISREFGPGLWAEADRTLADYIYSGEALRTLKGKKYHAKRNHLNNFKKNYPSYTYEPLQSAIIPEVTSFLERWYAARETLGRMDESLVCERTAIFEALSHMEALDYTGAVIRINGVIEALTMGERLNDCTAVIHVEKANPDIQGLYGAIHNEYLCRQWPDIEFVNREEDMGDAGLRKAKLSFNPVMLTDKWNIAEESPDTLHIHPVKAGHTQQMKALWRYCFTDSAAFTDWYFSNYYKHEWAVGAFMNGVLKASLQLVPYTLYLRGRELEASYVVGVDTAPEVRGLRAAGRLLAESLSISRKEGRPVALLMPFDAGFYRKYGWSYCYYKLNYTLKPEMLSMYADGQDDNICLKVTAPEADIKALDSVYRAYHKRHHGYVIRGGEQWKGLIGGWQSEGCFCCAAYTGGQPSGYLFYAISGRKLNVLELAYTNEASRRALLMFLYRHSAHIKKIVWQTCADDRSFLYFPDKVKTAVKPFIMARVADAALACEKISVADCVSGSVILKLKDEHLEWNDGVFMLTAGGGALKAIKLEKEEKWDISMGIDSFTQLLTGAAGIDALLERALATAADKETSAQGILLLREIFPEMKNDIEEYY